MEEGVEKAPPTPARMSEAIEPPPGQHYGNTPLPIQRHQHNTVSMAPVRNTSTATEGVRSPTPVCAKIRHAAEYAVTKTPDAR